METQEQSPKASVNDWLFYVIFALFACHEMDAVAAHEWRMLPGFNLLEDDVAKPSFILGHIPLFALLLFVTEHKSAVIRGRSRAIFAGICVAHSIAHFALSDHELYEFEAPVETITVHGAGLLAFIYLIVQRVRQKTPLS